jgi:hypothetical protein
MVIQPNVQTDTVVKAFLRSELQLIRSQQKLMSVLPRELASDYRYIPEILLGRFFIRLRIPDLIGLRNQRSGLAAC